MNGLLSRQLAEMPAILDSLFYQLVNTISTTVRVVGGGYEVVGS